MKKILLLLLIISTTGLSAQIKLSASKHDFGEITKSSSRLIELKAVNNSNKEEILIRITNPDNEFEYKFSNTVIPAHSSIDIRLQYNPRKKGTKNIKLKLYFGLSTIEFKIKADVKYISRNNTPCPDFDRPAEAKTNFETSFIVKDVNTNKTLSKSQILLTQQGQKAYEINTGRTGEVLENIKLAYYNFHVTKEGYLPMDTASFINRRNDSFIFYLEPTDAPVNTDQDDIIVEDTDTVTEDPISDNTDEEVTESSEETPIESNPAYSSSEYKANNIVFLLDVSTSMKREDRLFILKKAMSELSDMLRPEDVISIITYATNTEVIIEGESADNRQFLKKTINGIYGKGTTAGSKGIKKAYTIANKYFIEGGNNHVYIASDGAFNKNDDRLSKLVSKQAKNGVNLSVISLRSSDFAKGKLKELSDAGKGSFIEIEDMASAESALIMLVKSQSKR